MNTRFQDHLRALKNQGFVMPNAPAGFADADGQIFFARQLEYIEARTYDVLYQDLMYRQIFPTDTSIPAGVRSITYQTYDKAGKMRWINTAAKDIPRVDVAGKETTLPTHWGAASFAYNIGEIESARFAGVPLEQAKADACRRALEEGLNEIAWYGNADLGLIGFFSTGNGIPRTTAPNGAGGFPQWSTKTPDEIAADVNTIFSDVVEDTLKKEVPDTLLLPIAQYNLLRNTRLTDTGETLWSYVINKVNWIRSEANVLMVPELKGAGTGGVDVAVAYTRRPDKIEFKIPQDITFHPVQQHGLEWIVNATTVCGGLHIRYPLSAHILEDI